MRLDSPTLRRSEPGDIALVALLSAFGHGIASALQRYEPALRTTIK